MIIYISNQNNHGIGHTKKPLHAKRKYIVKMESLGFEGLQGHRINSSLHKQAIFGDMWQ